MLARWREPESCQLQRPSLPCISDRLRALAVFPISAEPSSGRREAAGARHHGFLWDDPVLGEEVRAGLCRPLAPQSAKPEQRLASGRGRG